MNASELKIEELMDIISSKASYADIVKILMEKENENAEKLEDYICCSNIDLSYYLDDETKNIIIDEVTEREIVVQYLGGTDLSKALYEAVYYDKSEALNIIEHYDIDTLRNIVEKYIS